MKSKLLMCVLNVFFCGMVCADGLGIWPINPRIDPPASATLLWAHNNKSNESISLQARIVRWRQLNNEDIFEDQTEFFISPPIIRVEPGVQQLFRVVSRSGALPSGSTELSYRVFIDEVPTRDAARESALSFQMRYSLPLFVGLPSDLLEKSLSARLTVLEQGLAFRVIEKPSPAIEVINMAPIHARLSSVKIHGTAPGAAVDLSPGLLGYVLPGSSREWPVSHVQMAALMQTNARITFVQERQELTIATAQ